MGSLKYLIIAGIMLLAVQADAATVVGQPTFGGYTTAMIGRLAVKVPTSTTVNGHALSSNVIVSASDLTTGTLPHAQLPALVSGDIPNNASNTSGTAAGLSANITESQVTGLVTDLAAKAPTASPVFSGPVTFGAVLFAALSTPVNGSFVYCSDCTVATPATCTANLLTSCVCAGSGTGALAKRLNGNWYCN